MMLLLLALLLVTPAPAAASLLFDWSGTCLTGCTGRATLHVETTDAYVPGTNTSTTLAGPTVLMAARYADSNLVFAPLLTQPIDYEGIVLLLPPGQGESRAWFQAEAFTGHADGTWKYEAEVSGALCPPFRADVGFCAYQATGVGGAWVRPSAVAWPGTLLMLGLGFAATARSRRSRS